MRDVVVTAQITGEVRHAKRDESALSSVIPPQGWWVVPTGSFKLINAPWEVEDLFSEEVLGQKLPLLILGEFPEPTGTLTLCQSHGGANVFLVVS